MYNITPTEIWYPSLIDLVIFTPPFGLYGVICAMWSLTSSYCDLSREHEGAERPFLSTETSIRSSETPKNFQRLLVALLTWFWTPQSVPAIFCFPIRRPSYSLGALPFRFAAARHPLQQWISMQPISRSAMTRMQTTCIILT